MIDIEKDKDVRSVLDALAAAWRSHRSAEDTIAPSRDFLKGFLAGREASLKIDADTRSRINETQYALAYKESTTDTSARIHTILDEAWSNKLTMKQAVAQIRVILDDAKPTRAALQQDGSPPERKPCAHRPEEEGTEAGDLSRTAAPLGDPNSTARTVEQPQTDKYKALVEEAFNNLAKEHSEGGEAFVTDGYAYYEDAVDTVCVMIAQAVKESRPVSKVGTVAGAIEDLSETILKLIDKNAWRLARSDRDGFGFSDRELGLYIVSQIKKYGTNRPYIWDMAECKSEWSAQHEQKAGSSNE